MAMMTVKEVAHLLHVHVNTVKRMTPEELPFLRISGRGDRRYRYKDVIAYLQMLNPNVTWLHARSGLASTGQEPLGADRQGKGDDDGR